MKLKIKKNWVVTILLIIILAICAETKFSFHGSVQKIVMSSVALYGFLLYIIFNDKRKIERKVFNSLFEAWMPFGFAALYTIVLVQFENQYNLPIAKHAVTTSIYAFVQMMFAFTLLLKYKNRAIDIVFYYISFSYCITMFLSLKEASISELILNYNSIYNLLERNDVGTAVVPIILLYLYKVFYFNEKNKTNIIRILVCFIILILCGKRSAIVSIAMGIVILLITTFHLKNKVRIFNIINIITILILFTYVIIIQTGLLTFICIKFGISTEGRIYVWNWFQDMYSISPMYLGKGLQFIHEYMQAHIAEGGAAISMVSNFDFLHNSNLQVYIELGFFGFFMWFSYFLYILPRKIKKRFGADVFYLASIILISMVYLFMTDNVMTYPVYQSTTYICIFSIVFYNEKKLRGENRNAENFDSCSCL